MKFEAVDGRENKAVKKANGARVEMAFFQKAEIYPPGEVAGNIIIPQALNLEACALQFLAQFRPGITAKRSLRWERRQFPGPGPKLRSRRIC